MDKEQAKQLNSYINSIAITAKLMNYTVRNLKNITTVSEDHKYKPVFMTLFFNGSSLITSYNGHTQTFAENYSHERKINHLQELLQKL